MTGEREQSQLERSKAANVLQIQNLTSHQFCVAANSPTLPVVSISPTKEEGRKEEKKNRESS